MPPTGRTWPSSAGVVTFSGAVDNPRLDILALRPNLDIAVGVAIAGSASAPRIRLYSEPDLPDNEKLSWLVLGRAPEGLAGADTALLQARADGAAGRRRRRGRPTSCCALEPSGRPFGAADRRRQCASTVLSVGKQISQRWYVGYERGVNATTGNWQLIYRLAQRFTVRAANGRGQLDRPDLDLALGPARPA